MDRFLELKGARLDQLSLVVLIGLVPNGQLLLVQVDGGTHIASDETLVNRPAFVEDID